jgi:hypothetical protein
MPRFVILEHQHDGGVHWDFMLESGDVLRTWRLDQPPAVGRPVAATAIADHRGVYLDYEGEISGGRGRVTQWDAGEFDWIANGGDAIVVALHGRRLRGDAHLTRTRSGDWSLGFIPVETTEAD